MQGIQFDYFRGMEAEQYSFYRVPKMLFTEECFKSLSCEAKLLYGLMLDRMGLSIKNRWFDSEDRAYIIFTVEETMELLGCGRQKAIKSMAELDAEKGIGLTEKKRTGLGRPNVIYVKHFMASGRPGREEQTTNTGNTQKYENQTSGRMKKGSQEVPKSNCNKTDKNKTDSNDTDPIRSYPCHTCRPASGRAEDMMDKMDGYREMIRRNISYYECYSHKPDHERRQVDELVELAVEVMSMPEDSTVRIAGADKPAAVVKSRFIKLNCMHIEYVLSAMQRNTTKVGNIKAYLLTALYNAPLTIGSYYNAEVNHDLYGSG